MLQLKKIQKNLIITATLATLCHPAFAQEGLNGFLGGIGAAIRSAKTQIQQGVAQAAPSSGTAGRYVRISANETQDSRVEIEGTLPQGTRWLMVHVTQGRTELQRAATLQNSANIRKTIYLNGGAGDYRIELFVSSAESRINSSYTHMDGFTVRNTDTRDHSFLAPSAEVQADDIEISNLARSITQGLASDRDKSVAIHDWIAQNIGYDAKAYYSQPPAYPPSDAVTTLQRREAFCEGYANLNAALHRAVGIRARVIRGAASPVFNGETAPSAGDCSQPTHGWNEVLIDGQWLIQDATWDAGFVQGPQFTRSPSRRFLFPNPKDFARSHTRCEVITN